jgi:hypothetical protein
VDTLVIRPFSRRLSLKLQKSGMFFQGIP